MKIGKRVLSIMMAIITLVSVVSISAEAASVKMAKLSLGYMVPVNSKGTKVLESVNLYGPYDYLNFYIKATKKETTYFFYEIYSDSKMTKCIDSGSVKCKYGEYSFSPEIKLKGKYKTKTYYAVTYAAKVYSSGTVKIDSKSVKEFKIKVDRTDAFKKRIITLNSVTNTANGPKITWDRISGVSKYYVYRRNIDGTKWTKVGSVSSKKSYYTDTSVKNKNGNYIYTVKAVNKKGDATRYHYAGLVCLFAKAPVIDSVSVAGDNEIKIEWGKTKSGAKYTVMRKESGGEWKTLKKSLTTTSYTDKTAENNKTYQYTVKASFSTDYGTATSSYHSTNGEKIKFFEAPELENVSVVDTGVLVSWNAVEGVSAYKIFRRPLDKSENWTELGTVDSTVLEFTDTTADLESAYIYTVRSEGETKKGSFFKAGIEFVVLDEPTNVKYIYANKTDGIEVTWQSVSYADQYNVYTMDTNGQWQLQKIIEGPIDGTCFAVFIPDRYGEIKYTVTALRDGTNETQLGQTVYDMVFYPDVDISVAEARKDGNLLRWNDKGAEKYNIYRITGEATEYELIETIEVTTAGETLSFTDSDVATGKYKYAVKGVYNGVEQTVYFDTETFSRISDENIVRDENVVFYRNRNAHTIKISADSGDYEKEYYAYNYKKDTWERISANEGRLHNNSSMSNKDGEYTVSVVYIVDGAKTPVDAVTYTGRFWDVSFDTISAKSVKNGIRIEWNEIDGAVKYIVRYSLEGSDELTETAEVAINSKGKYFFDFERDKSKTNHVDFIVEAVDAEGRITAIDKSVTAEPNPVMYAAVRKDNGQVWVYWNYYWQWQDYIVMRKTEGGSWKKIDKDYTCVYSKKYKGKECAYFVDKTAEKGVKYTYTVIAKGDEDINDYMYINSYYDTEGVTCKG